MSPTAAVPSVGGRFVLSARLALVHASFFGFIGVFLPFWPVWLESKEMSAEQIGLLLGAGIWIKVVANPFFSSLADRWGRPKAMLVCLTLACFACFWLFAWVEGFLALLAVSLVVAAFHSSQIPVADDLTMRFQRDRGLHYGRIRLWGSVAFMIANVLGGWWLNGQPAGAIFGTLAGLLGISILTALTAPEHRGEAESMQARKGGFRAVLSNRGFVLAALANTLLQTTHVAYYGFATLYWRQAGIDDTVIGFLWAEGILIEIALFSVATPVVARFGYAGMFLLAAGAGLIRWTVLGTTTDLAALVAVQGLHGITFGACYLGMVHYVQDRVPSARSATALSLVYGPFMGMAFGLAFPAAGWLYEAIAGGAFLAMAALSAAGGLVALFLLRMERNRADV